MLRVVVLLNIVVIVERTRRMRILCECRSACLSPELPIPDHIDTNLSCQHNLQFHSQSPSNLRFPPHSHDNHPNTRTALLAGQQYISGILAQDFLRIHSVEFRVRVVGNRGCHRPRKFLHSAAYVLKIHNKLTRSRECSAHTNMDSGGVWMAPVVARGRQSRE